MWPRGEAGGGWGVPEAAFDGDGEEDVFVAYVRAETNAPHVNGGNEVFTAETIRTRLGSPRRAHTGFGTLFVDYDNDGMLDLFAVNGEVTAIESLVQAGERIFNLERQWLLRAGFTGADDTLPRRMTHEPIPAGPTAGQVNRLAEMLPEYYALRGWSSDGVPGAERLVELGLETQTTEAVH